MKQAYEHSNYTSMQVCFSLGHCQGDTKLGGKKSRCIL